MRVFKLSLVRSGPKILRSGSASPNLILVVACQWYHSTSMVQSYLPSGILSLHGARSSFHMLFCSYKITFARLASLVLFMNLCTNNCSYPLRWISGSSSTNSMKRSNLPISFAKGVLSYSSSSFSTQSGSLSLLSSSTSSFFWNWLLFLILIYNLR